MAEEPLWLMAALAVPLGRKGTPAVYLAISGLEFPPTVLSWLKSVFAFLK